MEGLLSDVGTLDLQGMSCHGVALQIFHGYVSRSDCSNISEIQKSHRDVLISVLGLSLNYRSDLDEAVESLMVPQSIKKHLKLVLTRVVNEIVDWLLELSKTIAVKVYDLNWCVWSANGRIDYIQSAMKILSTVSELSNQQKFAIMCEFCLEDELEELNFDIKSKFRTNRLIEYWYHSISGDLFEMKRSKDLSLSLEADMALYCLRNRTFLRWTAFEYFWRRMHYAEQIEVVKETCYPFHFKHISACHLERILGMMSNEQHGQLFSSDGDYDYKVVENFVGRHSEDSLKSLRWALLSAEMFASTVKYLVRNKLNSAEWMSWFVELWDSASDEFKILAAEETKNNLPKFRLSRCSLKLYCRIKPLQSGEPINDEILKLACWLRTEINYDCLNELLKACVSSTNDQSKAATKLSYVKNVCLKLILKLNSHAFANGSFCYQLSKWNVLNEFIDLMYPESGSVASDWKQKLMMSCIFCSPQYEDSADRDVTKLIEIVECEFPKDVEHLKRSLFHSFLGMFKFYDDYSRRKRFLIEMRFPRFVKWCVGDGDKAVLDDEGGAFVDTVFEEVLDALNKFYKHPRPLHCRLNESLLSSLDKWLFLFLINKEEVKKCKLAKVTSFDGFEVVQSILLKNDELSKEKLLNWFFDNDQSAIRKFKSKKLKVE